MPLADTYRRQVVLLIKVLPFVAAEKCFALKGGTADEAQRRRSDKGERRCRWIGRRRGFTGLKPLAKPARLASQTSGGTSDCRSRAEPGRDTSREGEREQRHLVLPAPGVPLVRVSLKPSILGYYIVFRLITSYIRLMLPLPSLGEQIATKRKALGLTQPALAKKARVGLSTLDALENGRLGELGYSKITNILTVLGLELKLQDASARRPTLEELVEEGRDDQGLDRRR